MTSMRETDFSLAPAPDIGATSSNVTPLDARRRNPPWQNSVVNTLCRFLELPVGWDSYNGRPLRHDTGMFTLQLLNSVLLASTPAPHIVPIANGGVQAEWHQNHLDVELYISAPYACELTVIDHLQNTSETVSLTTNFDRLSAALKTLVDYNRHLQPVAHAG
jgi:hypothetical protein